MFFDFGWSEILLIGVVALLVIGPKDLPKAMRVAGYWMRKARALSQEFHNSVEEVIREAELAEMRQELKKATEIDLEAEFERRIEPDGALAAQPDLPGLLDFSPSEREAAVAEIPFAQEHEIEPGHQSASASLPAPAGPALAAAPALAPAPLPKA